MNCLKIIQDLEYALGEVELQDGIPDVKFSRVRSRGSDYLLMAPHAKIHCLFVKEKGLTQDPFVRCQVKYGQLPSSITFACHHTTLCCYAHQLPWKVSMHAKYFLIRSDYYIYISNYAVISINDCEMDCIMPIYLELMLFLLGDSICLLLQRILKKLQLMLTK